jgi:hypothetical protein
MDNIHNMIIHIHHDNWPTYNIKKLPKWLPLYQITPKILQQRMRQKGNFR